ncbi:RNA polymerase sigma factor [Planctomycetota bacterium]
MDKKKENELVRAAQAGCVESLGVLYERYYESMAWLAYSVVFDRDLAQDVAQETFTVVCRTITTLKKPQHFGGWLSRICRHRAIDTLRRQRGNTVPLPEDMQACETQEGENGQAVRLAIAALPQMYREIVVLHYFHHRSYEQIENTLGISLHTVKGRLFRARKQLAQILKNNGYHEGT